MGSAEHCRPDRCETESMLSALRSLKARGGAELPNKAAWLAQLPFGFLLLDLELRWCHQCLCLTRPGITVRSHGNCLNRRISQRHVVLPMLLPLDDSDNFLNSRFGGRVTHEARVGEKRRAEDVISGGALDEMHLEGVSGWWKP